MRAHAGVLRWLGAACVLALAVGGVGLRRSSPRISLTLSRLVMPANGTSIAQLELRSRNHHPLEGLEMQTSDVHRLSVEAVSIDGDHATAILRSGVMPGPVEIRACLHGSADARAQIELTLEEADSAGDGTPDFLRLVDEADRQAFRRWFTFVAEAQFFSAGELPAEVNDCAGLLRFSYREALRDHGSSWARALHLPPIAADVPPVRQYSFPFTPVGAALFRVRAAPFRATDLQDGTFAEFADANTLRRFSTHFVSRDVGRAKPGDLMFYRQFDRHSPYHAMIFLGRSQFEQGTDSYVVYHTGPTGNSMGEIRRPTVHELLKHPDSRWHPVPENPAFLGVYRWNILRGAY